MVVTILVLAATHLGAGVVAVAVFKRLRTRRLDRLRARVKDVDQMVVDYRSSPPRLTYKEREALRTIDTWLAYTSAMDASDDADVGDFEEVTRDVSPDTMVWFGTSWTRSEPGSTQIVPAPNDIIDVEELWRQQWDKPPMIVPKCRPQEGSQ